MRKILLAAALAGGMLAACTQKSNNNQNNEGMNTTLTLTQEWDKVFPLSEKVSHKKVTFETQYGLTLAADLYTPKDAKGKLAAIAVSGPFGAVKEQCSGLYAMKMAERGFVALAFDPSGSCRFPVETRECGCREDWHHRHLRLGRHRPECCRCRYSHQGYGSLNNV